MVEVNLFTSRAVYLENGESKPAFSVRKNPRLFIIKVLPPQHGVFARFYKYSNARARRVSNPITWIISTVELSEFSLYLASRASPTLIVQRRKIFIIYIYMYMFFIYIYIYIYVRTSCTCRSRARYAQTSDRPVEVQRSI